MWSYRGSSVLKLISIQPCKIIVRIYDESYQYVVHFTLPSFRHWSISFIKNILSGKKLVSVSLIAIENQWLRDHEIVKLNIPNYPEYSVKSMYSKFKDILDIASHMSDFKEEYPEKTHWNKVRCTLYSTKMYDLILESLKKRGINDMSNKNEMIELSPKIADEINNLVIMPSK